MSRLRWLVLPVFVLPVGWLLLTGFSRDAREVPSPLIGRPLPPFEAATLDGERLASDALRGRPAIVNVWASWCGPCVDEHPVLLGLEAEHGDELSVVGLLYQDEADAARRWLARYGDGGWPTLLDPDGGIALDLGVTGPPETYFVDASGIVRFKWFGPLSQQVVDEQLAALGVSGR
ncbi:MAG TPA: DsbE family thiol:disulfide interchange protein [Candidatus Limnocylindria bacterium]|nr:DsbE family thiol:disulfide interchange protein [Candidatus Limnocylindria bacterium]